MLFRSLLLLGPSQDEPRIASLPRFDLRYEDEEFDQKYEDEDFE